MSCLHVLISINLANSPQAGQNWYWFQVPRCLSLPQFHFTLSLPLPLSFSLCVSLSKTQGFIEQLAVMISKHPSCHGNQACDLLVTKAQKVILSLSPSAPHVIRNTEPEPHLSLGSFQPARPKRIHKGLEKGKEEVEEETRFKS